MSISSTPQNSMALVVSPEASDQTQSKGDETELQQPRQPTSMQGLLRFCMEATKSEEALEPEFVALEDEVNKR